MSNSVSRVLVDFFTALKMLNGGHRITKLEWADENIYGVLRNSMLSLHKSDGIFYAWTLSEGDLNGTDWYTLS